MPDIYGICVYKAKYNNNKQQNLTQEWDTRDQQNINSFVWTEYSTIFKTRYLLLSITDINLKL